MAVSASFSAFGGQQRENICYIDGDHAYDWYMENYRQLREECADHVSKEAFALADSGENLEELPLAQTVRVKKALIIETVDAQKDEIRFALDVKGLAKKFEPSVPKSDKKGKILLAPEKVKIIRRQIVADQKKEQELRSRYPQLEIFAQDG